MLCKNILKVDIKQCVNLFKTELKGLVVVLRK